jgi:REP element-mobilizing transposase RayT
MARKPRIEYEGAFYHVITRGNQRQKIFRDTTDYQKYLQFLTIYKNRYRFFLHAYVLMGNHVHLLIETQAAPLSKILQGLNQRYTLYYNHKYRTVGHLFQGRYKAILCEKEAYLLALLRYIQRNPLRAKIVDRLDRYPWSSHHAYRGKSNPLSLVDTDQVLRMFSENKHRAKRLYREFILESQDMKPDEVYAVKEQRVQGSDAFVDRVLTDRKEELPPKKKPLSLDVIAEAVARNEGVEIETLRSGTRVRIVTKARKVFSLVARNMGHAVKNIAAYLSVDGAAISGYEPERIKLAGQVAKIGRQLEKT